MGTWSEQRPETEEGWMFPNLLSNKPYYSTEIQKQYLKSAGIKLGLGPIGWHIFCHTYRSWPDETRAPNECATRTHPLHVL